MLSNKQEVFDDLMFAILVREEARYLLEPLLKAGKALGLEVAPPEVTEELMTASIPEKGVYHQEKARQPKQMQRMRFGKQGKWK